MGCRRQPRLPMTLTASLCGMDVKGRAFLERVRITNLSRDGALLEEVNSAVKLGDLVTLRCDETTRRFRVIWAEPGSGEGRQVGLAGIGPVPTTAECWLPASGSDEFVRPRVSIRRESSRYECEIAVELRMRDVATPLWVTASDISEAGCCVQVPHAMEPNTEMSIALWLDGERVWMQGKVTHSLYGCGTGIEFTKIDRVALLRIANVLANSETEVSDRRASAVEQNPLYAAYSATS
ncbi:MAG: PilZ domain-containing protein [Terriglobales bacterium]